MKSYTIVSRKTVEDDRIAICPKFGCENLTRVKPLKLGFLGFGKYPKCKEHQIPLVYVDERIGDFVNASLSCLFDVSSLPPQNLLFSIKKEIPEEVESFIKKWIYCITTGRGAPIISRYMDSISNSYFKQLSKKQLKFLKNENKHKKTGISLAIKNGIQEITDQYTRLLKHLRIHHEVFNEPKELKPLSNRSKKILSGWLESSKKANKLLLSIESKQDIPLSETKKYYDSILNMGICMCLLGYSTKKRENMTKQISAFDRFNAYFEFYSNGLTQKFSKTAIKELLQNFTKQTPTMLDKKDEKSEGLYAFGKNLSSSIPGLKIITLGQPHIHEEIIYKRTEFLDNDFFKTLNPPPNPIVDYVNEWFTNLLSKEMKNYEFLKKFASLRNMSSFFGLSKTYLYDKKYKKSVISHEYLDMMRESVIEYIENLIRVEYGLKDKAKEARNRLVSIIEIYRQAYFPKLTANTQINEKLDTGYFRIISSPQQAYYIGLLFADGWISIQRTSGGSASYRVSISLKVEDKPVIERFSETLGLDKSRVLERDSTDLRTGKVYRMAYIQIGVGSTSIKNTMAHDLINLGMTYKKNNKGKRSKVPILPVFCDEEGNVNQTLMLAFLLGYFDGDGTLKSSNSGEIYSNNFKFLATIKAVFNLGDVSDAERIVYDPTTNTHSERHLYSLYLNKSIIKEMMSLGIISMERKSLDAELIKLDAPIMTKQRLWLKKVLPIKFLRQILTTHSPSKIAELLGIDHNTLLKFMRNVYNLNLKDKGYYIKLSYERKQSSAKNKLNKIYNERTQLIAEIGERNPFNQ